MRRQNTNSCYYDFCVDFTAKTAKEKPFLNLSLQDKGQIWKGFIQEMSKQENKNILRTFSYVWEDWDQNFVPRTESFYHFKEWVVVDFFRSGLAPNVIPKKKKKKKEKNRVGSNPSRGLLTIMSNRDKVVFLGVFFFSATLLKRDTWASLVEKGMSTPLRRGEHPLLPPE